MSCYKKCAGCGKELSSNINDLSYSPDTTKPYCQRCFKLINYNQNTKTDETITAVKRLQQELIIKNNDYVFMILDALNFENSIVTKYLQVSNLVFVINKIDLLYKNVNLVSLKSKIKSVIDELRKKPYDLFIISTKSKSGIAPLIEKIKNIDFSSNIYFIGKSNVGKSSLINIIIKKSEINQKMLTVSHYVNTTADFKKIILFKHKIIDTPGFIDDNDVTFDLPKSTKTVRPFNFNILKSTCFYLSDFILIKIDCDIKANVVFFNQSTNRINKISNITKIDEKISNFKSDTNVKEFVFDDFKSDIKYNITFANLCKISFKNVSKITVLTSKGIIPSLNKGVLI